MDEKMRLARNEYYTNRRRNMTEEQREQERERHRLYMRKWRADHPEKVLEYRDRFWQKRADKEGTEG